MGKALIVVSLSMPGQWLFSGMINGEQESTPADLTEPGLKVHLAETQTQHLIKLETPIAAITEPSLGAAALMEISGALM